MAESRARPGLSFHGLRSLTRREALAFVGCQLLLSTRCTASCSNSSVVAAGRRRVRWGFHSESRCMGAARKPRTGCAARWPTSRRSGGWRWRKLWWTPTRQAAGRPIMVYDAVCEPGGIGPFATAPLRTSAEQSSACAATRLRSWPAGSRVRPRTASCLHRPLGGVVSAVLLHFSGPLGPAHLSHPCRLRWVETDACQKAAKRLVCRIAESASH